MPGGLYSASAAAASDAHSELPQLPSTASFVNRMSQSIVFGEEGSGEGQFVDPSFVALDADDNIFIADTSNNRVQVFDCNGAFVRSFGSEGGGKGQFCSPQGMVVDSKGRLAVVDRDNHRIQLFSLVGEYLSEFGSEGTEPGQFQCPRDICVDSQGNFLVADFDNNRIQVMNERGEFVKQIGKEGGAPGEFHGPSNVCVNLTGTIIVTDMLNGRIQQLAPDGAYMRDLKGPASDEHFIGTVGLSAISDDEILMTETEGHRIMVISLTLGVKKIYGIKGSVPGTFHNPSHAKLDGRGRMVIADMGNNRVQVIPR